MQDGAYRTSSTLNRAEAKATDSSSSDRPDLLLPALPLHLHAASWLAGWSKTGEETLLGYQLWAIEQRVTDRQALLPVVLVLTGDKADCVVVERFELTKQAAEDVEARQQVWNRTKALLRRLGMRVTDTPRGKLPVTSLTSLSPSLSLLLLPSTVDRPGDYRRSMPALYQSINIRRLGFGGRSGFRLIESPTPAQTLHFRQAYQLPIPPPGPPTHEARGTDAHGGVSEFARTIIDFVKLVQHALALFGLGPVKSYMCPRVHASLADSTGSPPNKSDLERQLIETFISRSDDSILLVEDWADAIGLPIPEAAQKAQAPHFGPTRDEETGDEPDGGSAILLSGDGLLCDTTVAALSVFRLGFAERFVPASTSTFNTVGTSSGPGAYSSYAVRDDSLLPPSLLAALLSLAVSARHKMVAIGAGKELRRHRTIGRTTARDQAREKDARVPRDIFGKRERFLLSLQAFRTGHPDSFPLKGPPVLTPALLENLNHLFAAKFPSSSTFPSSRHQGGSGSESSPSHGRLLSLHRPHLPHQIVDHLPFGAVSRSRTRAETCETASLDDLIEVVILGRGADGAKSTRTSSGTRTRLRSGGLAGRTARRVWNPEEPRRIEEESDEGAYTDGDALSGSTKQRPRPHGDLPRQSSKTRTLSTHNGLTVPSATSDQIVPAVSSPTSLPGTAAGPLALVGGLLRGVRDKAGRAGRRVGDGLGLLDSQSASTTASTSVDTSAHTVSSGTAPALSIHAPPSRPESRASHADAPPAAAPIRSRTASPRASRDGVAFEVTSNRSRRLSPLLTHDFAHEDPTNHAAELSAPRRPTSSRHSSTLPSPLGLESSIEGTGRPGAASQSSLGLLDEETPSAAKLSLARANPLGPPSMRRAVSETQVPKRRPSPVPDDDDLDRLRSSFLFAGETGTNHDLPVDHDSGSARDDEDNEGSAPFAEESHARRTATLAADTTARTLPRRHSFNLVCDAPEPRVWLSRRRLEADMNLRTAAWQLHLKQKRLEDMVQALESVRKSYDDAIAAFDEPLARKQAQLDSLSTAVTRVQDRLDQYSAQTISPLYALSTGTSRLQYAQAVLDDKIRDIFEFDRALRAKVDPDSGRGSLEVAVQTLASERMGVRRVVGVVEAFTEWMGGVGRRWFRAAESAK